MKGLKAKDLRSKSVAELEELVNAERAAIFKSRRDLVFRQLTDTTLVKTQKRNIAKILTVINEKKGSEAK